MKNTIFNTTKVLLTAVAGLLIVSSCTKNFEEYNTMPYRPGYIIPAQLLTPMMRHIIGTHENESQMIDQMIGMEYGGYTSANTSWGTDGAFATYNPRQKWYGNMYNDLLKKIYGDWSKVQIATEAIGPVYQMAQIIRVGTMIKLTDTYGPIPYTQINGQDVTVAYDKQEDVYLAMIQDLTTAADEIVSYLGAGGNTTLIEGYDVSTYNADMKKWVKYANSLRLRLAIRMSKTNQAAKAQEVAEAAVNHIGGLISLNADNLSITPESKNPYYVAGIDFNDGELRVNASLISYMDGYADPRCAAYFTTVGGKFVGLRSGIEKLSQSTYNTKTSLLNLKDGTSTKLLVMCAAEVAFLKAEGALMGWSMGGTPEMFYNEGITLSFEQHGVAGASTYMADAVKVPVRHNDPVSSARSAEPMSTITIKWNDGATAEQKLERLIVQKWIAMFPVGFEAWCDIRRTGYPKLFPAVNNLSGGVVNSARGMRRVQFAYEEFTTNTANVNAAIELLGGADNGATDLWWAKKN